MFESFLLKVISHARHIKMTLLVSVILISAVSCAAMNSSKYAQEAAPVVEEFIKLLDDGEYQAASEKVSLQFQTNLNQQNFSMWVADLRRPMGKALEREPWGATYSTSFTGRPDGEYLTMYFKTNFENKKFSREAVFLFKKNNTWVVTNYGFQ